ncbi:uncharacterized protein RCC_05486 [Ramularia collo-cygni]|uniref:Uncharacterized protein n=1 Tax=Ramularia collo-cygni TaxID=112498 RepID=A0A2D3UYZ1_9PEZI|nr:uncharacterized protein RCC_05486 [Ramularia collo-cygni]CZT19635.1 uncharacterized protein RCC_05486 [Ramularia collo-cygni]
MPPPYPLPARTTIPLVTAAATALQIRPDGQGAFFMLCWRFINSHPHLNIPWLQYEIHPNMSKIPRSLAALIGHFLQKWGAWIWPDIGRDHLTTTGDSLYYSRDGQATLQCILDWNVAFPEDVLGVPPIEEQVGFSTLGKACVGYFVGIIHLSLDNEQHLLARGFPNEHMLWLEIANARAG